MIETTTVLVTGATDGIGLHTASNLVQQGRRVIVHGRDPAKIAAATQRLRDLLPDKEARLDLVPDGVRADLSSLAAVRGVADDLKKYPPIDVLVNNAAVFKSSREESVDGHELTLATNVLAPVLLTSLLLPAMLSSRAADGRRRRVVNVSSISHMDGGGRVPSDNLQQTNGRYDRYAAYGLSKLLVIMWTYKLAGLVANVSDNVTVNTLDPGTVNTKMLAEGWGPCGIPVEQANNETLLSIDASYENSNGKYFVGGKEGRSSAQTYDEKVRDEVWQTLENLSGSNHDFLSV